MKAKDKVVLITGSSRGIGRAIAMRFAEEGASVIINSSRSRADGHAVLEALPKRYGQKHFFIQADISEPFHILRMMKEIDKKYGRLDILVNNAGVTKFIKHNDLNGLTQDLFDTIYKTHLRGSFLCVKEALPLFKKSKDAQVINIASIAAITAVGSNIAYCAVKAAVVNMTMSLARALAPHIRVNAVSPGLTQTGLIKGWGRYKAEQIKKTPLRRLGTPGDVAEAVFVLATSLNYMTGQNMVLDGGRTLE